MRRQRYEDDADAADFQVIAAQVHIAMGNAAAATALVESAIVTYEQETARFVTSPGPVSPRARSYPEATRPAEDHCREVAPSEFA